jgi:hypothetical protein
VTRWPVAAFVALVIATVGAFFVTQHLKVTTPLLTGTPIPFPGTINPVNGRTCIARTPRGILAPVDFRRMEVSFYLLNRADDVDVYIVADPSGPALATLPGSGRYLRTKKRRVFVWNGREDNGRLAPDGTYYIRVWLVHQGRYVIISNQNTGKAEPVVVQTRPPDLEVTGVAPATLSTASGAQTVTIHYSGNQGLRPRVRIYRLGATGGQRLVKTYAATSRSGTTVWDGTLAGGAPAPPGRYLVGLHLVDRTCNVVNSPTTGPGARRAIVSVG